MNQDKVYVKNYAKKDWTKLSTSVIIGLSIFITINVTGIVVMYVLFLF